MTIPTNFSALNSDTETRPYWWIEIEGIRPRFGSYSPTWNPAATGSNRRIYDYLTGIPEIQGQKVKPLNGSTDPHEFSVDILDVGEELTALFSTHDSSMAQTVLTTALSSNPAITTVVVADSSGFTAGDDVYIDRETCYVTDVPDGTHLTVDRAQYGSEAAGHLLTDSQNNTRQVVVSNRPRFFYTREVVFCENRVGLAEADAIKLRGFLDELGESSGVWSLRCSGHLKRVAATICEELPSTVLYGVVWGGGQSWNGVEYIGRTESFGHNAYCYSWALPVARANGFPSAGAVLIDSEIIKYDAKNDTHDMLMLVDYEDELANPVTSPGVGYRKFVPIGSGRRGMYDAECMGHGEFTDLRFDGDELKPPSMDWHAHGSEVKLVLTETNFTAGTDPVSIVLQVLLSKEGDGSNHATYDKLPKGAGLGIPASKVDVTGMETLRDAYGYGTHSLKFCIAEPVEAKEWLEENILRPSMLYLVEKWDGTIGIGRIHTLAQAQVNGADLAIDEDVLVALPAYSPGKPPMSRLTIKCNYHPAQQKSYATINVRLGDAEERYRSMGENFEIEIKTVMKSTLAHSTTTIYPATLAILPVEIYDYINTLWNRYAVNRLPTIDAEIPYQRMTDVQVGSIVTVSCSVLPDTKNADRGISAEYCQVVGVKPQPTKGTVSLELWQVDVLDGNYRRIAPSGRVSAYANPGAAGDPRITLASSVYTATGDKPAEGVFVVGDKVRLLSAVYAELTADETVEVKTVGSAYIDLVAAPTTPPTAGCIVETAPYDSASSTQKANWSFMADSNEVLGAADDDAHRRE